MDALASLISSGGGKTFKWDRPGDSVTGTIISADIRQAREYGTGKPEFWSDGGPKNQIVIGLATDERDPNDPNDDGQRNVYLKAYGQHLEEVRRVCKAAGISSLQIGSQLTVTYSGDGPREAGKNPPKHVSLTITTPLASLVDTPTTAPAAGGVSVDQAAMAKALAAGVAPDKITPDVLALFKSQL